MVSKTVQDADFFIDIANSLQIGILISHKQLIVRSNNFFLDMFGYEHLSEIQGRSISILVPPMRREQVIERNIQREQERLQDEVFEQIGNTKNGRQFPIEISATLAEISGETFCVFMVEDITERKILKEEARRNLQFYRSMFENTHESILLFDFDQGRFIKANLEAERLFKMNERELCEFGPLDLSPSEQFGKHSSAEMLLELMTRTLRGERPIFQWTFIIRGLLVECEVRMVSLDSKEERLLRMSIIDITSRKEVQRQIAESEVKYRNLVEWAPEAIFVYDHKAMSFIEVNSNAERLTGRSKRELIGAHPTILYEYNPDEPMTELIETSVQQVLNSNEQLVLEVKVVNVRENRKIPCELRMVRIPGSKNLVRGSMLDISKRKQTEKELQATREQLFMANKLDSIGRISSSIAHDFNNLLFVIDGYANILQLSIDDDLRENIDFIRQAASKASNLVKQLLSYSRKRILKPTRLDLNHVLVDIFELINSVLPENIDTKLSIEEELDAVDFDESQLEQIIINMILNARDAMPKGGSLTLVANNTRKYNQDIMQDFVKIAISDTGIGISPEEQKKIFQPFYTSKPEGLGSGLGLSTVLGIVSQSGGLVELESAVGQGSTFTIYLPSSLSEESKIETHLVRTVEIREPSSYDNRKKSIMVVEDDQLIADLLEEILENNGYLVKTFIDTDEAQSYFEIHADEVDLVISDLIMPKMNGMQLSKLFLERKQNQKMLFMTGYSRLAVIEEIYDMGYEILEKPFKTDTLLKLLELYF